jgi:hypothetical protein
VERLPQGCHGLTIAIFLALLLNPHFATCDRYALDIRFLHTPSLPQALTHHCTERLIERVKYNIGYIMGRCIKASFIRCS